jgi:hypothetical protein
MTTPAGEGGDRGGRSHISSDDPPTIPALTERHLGVLTDRGLSERVITARGYRSSTSKKELALLGFTAAQQLHSALIIPIYDVFKELTVHQIRPDDPRRRDDGKVIKYELPRKSRSVLDVHPYARGLVANPRYSLVVTEGILKADACLSKLGVPAVALTGVWNWRGRNADDGLVALADWERVPLNREVLVIFDSDIVRKAAVLEACRRLGALLTRRGAEVAYTVLPDGAHGAKVGLDDFVAGGGKLADLRALSTAEPPRPRLVVVEPEDTFEDVPVEDGAALLEELVVFVRRYLVLQSTAAADAVALWIVQTWAIASFTVTARLLFRSAEKRSGKTRALELVLCTARLPRMSVMPSAAAVFRLTEAEHPTWLLDEVDNLLKSSDEAKAALFAVINSGYRRGASVPKVEKVGDKLVTVEHSVFSCVALAGIGDGLPDTTTDRSVVIELQRKLPSEKVERFHIERTHAGAASLRRRTEAWARRNAERLAEAEPEVPGSLDDRAAEIWEPLLAVADLARGDWPDRARRAAQLLSGAGRAPANDSEGVRLLRDLWTLWNATDDQTGEAIWDQTRVATEIICAALNRLEGAEWSTSVRGLGINGQSLAGLLRRYGIKSEKWDGGVRGYVRARFEPIWERYLEDDPRTPEKSATRATAATAGVPEGADGGPVVARVAAVADFEGVPENKNGPRRIRLRRSR